MGIRFKILTNSVVFLLVACNTVSPAATAVTGNTPIPSGGTQNALSPATSSASSEPGTLDWMINTPANPIDLTVDLDSDRAVEAVISPDGGKLEAIGGDGTHYFLDLPAGSVVMDTLIRMTPVQTLSGLPLKQSASAWAVRLEPEGLQLLVNASLTIQFTSPPPVIQQIPFQYQEAGKAFNLAAPVVNATVDTGVDAKGIQLDIAHFSGYGMAIGYLGELEPIRQRLGGSVEDRLIAEFARTLAIERQKMLLGSSDEGVVVLDSEALRQLLDQYFNQVIPQRIEAAKTECAAGRLVLQQWLIMERMRQLLGTAGLDPGEPFPLPLDFAGMVTQRCVQEEYEMCRDQHIIDRMFPIALRLLREQALSGSINPHLGPEIEQLIQNCLTFELDFDSTGKEVFGQGGIQITETIVVNARVPIEWHPDLVAMKVAMDGQDVLAVTQYTPDILPSDFCKITSKETQNGQFIVPSLMIRYSSEGYQDGIPKMEGFVMDYTLSGVEEKWSDECIQHGVLYWSYVGEWGLSYQTAYGVLHQPESYPLVELPMTPNSFRAANWTLSSGDMLASMEWNLSGADPAVPNTIFEESGTFKLYHKPK